MVRLPSNDCWFYLTYEELKLRICILAIYLFSVILSYLWGIETRYIRSKALKIKAILSYLWGIETGYETLTVEIEKRFYLTYEELKLRINRLIFQLLADFILPMRNWNFKNVFLISLINFDFILPMRNWNFFSAFSIIFLCIWFYLTYEELKPIFAFFIIHSQSSILSYLWGIETSRIYPMDSK